MCALIIASWDNILFLQTRPPQRLTFLGLNAEGAYDTEGGNPFRLWR
jgi:hypothetical protein